VPKATTLIDIDTQDRTRAIETIAKYFQPQIQHSLTNRHVSITDFAAQKFFVPETGEPLKLMPHQSSILEYALDPDNPFIYGGTIVYSTIKKSGKTCLSSLVARYVAETYGTSNEIYCVANDQEQARGRGYQKLLDSIELDPTYMKKTAINGWKIIERAASFEPNRSIVKALSNDYRGESGSNPTATFWSELWAYTSEASRRLWEELTPVPTRERGFRFIDTYAGFTDESDLLLELYNMGKGGRRLTHEEIFWPFDDEPPIWVNESASLFLYWDSGVQARRMPWQTPEYYQTQAQMLRPNAFERLHLNYWTSSTDSFLPTEWFESCRSIIPPLDNHMPVVIGVDASVSGDCTALVGVTRNPTDATEVMIRFYEVWSPTKGSPIDLEVVAQRLKELCLRYNVVEIAFDPYQLHKLMTDLTHEGIAWCRPFNQGIQREIADKQLMDLIRDRHLYHNCGPEYTSHIQNAAAKYNIKDDSKLRIVKKSASQHIDLVVATSMAVEESLRLNL
jgi:phage terminase large subunit-like protein